MKIVWSENARLSYAEELEYIAKKWTINEVTDFMDLVEGFTSKLKTGTIEGRISPKTNIRSFVISKQTTLFFDVNEAQGMIEILLFWNNKMNPKELGNKLRNR